MANIYLNVLTLLWLTTKSTAFFSDLAGKIGSIGGTIGDIGQPPPMMHIQDPNAVTHSSSVYSYYGHGRGVDGKSGSANQDDFKKYCFASSWEANPWWSITYDKIKVIPYLYIYNRKDCCGTRLHDFDVYVSVDSYDPTKSKDKVLCKHHTGTVAQGGKVKVTCDTPLEGQHVIIEIQGSREMLSFCEVSLRATDITTNVALSRPTFQSGLNGKGYSYNAVDGDMGSRFFQDGCTETPYRSDPWWSVDFGLLKEVNYVYITNRGDCCSERLHDFDVYVMSDSTDPTISTSKTLCGHYDGIVGSGATVRLVCEKPVIGLYLAIMIPGSNERLTVCEVQVNANAYDIDENIFLKIFNALQTDLPQIIELYEQYKFLLPAAKTLCSKGTASYCDLETVLYQLQILTGYSVSTNVHRVRSMMEFKEVSLTIYLNELKQSKDFHSLLLKVQFGLNTVIDVTEEVGKDVGDYFGALASYDTQIAEADAAFITGRLSELKSGSTALFSVTKTRITRIVDTAITVLSLEVAEKTAQLMYSIVECFNPINVIFGGCDPNDIADRLADLTSAIRRLAKATTLADGLSKLYSAVTSLIEKFAKNKEQLKAITKMVNEFSDMTDDEKIAASEEFIIAYAAYTPYVTDQDIAKIVSSLETTAFAGCELIDSAGGSAANVAATVMEEADEDCLKIAPELAQLESYYNDWYSFQFDLVDSFAVIVRGHIRTTYANRLQSVSTRIDIKDGVIGFIMGELLYQKVATSLCNFVEYRNGGERPSMCETSFFTDSQVEQLIAYNIPQLDSSIDKTVYIPTEPQHDGDVSFIDVDKLLEGKTVSFQAPINDKDWLLKYEWLSNDVDPESSFFVLGMNLFVPGLKCHYQHSMFLASVEGTSHENARYYRGDADGISYIIPKLSLKFQYEKTDYCNVNDKIYMPVKANNDSTSIQDHTDICVTSNGHISECDHTFAPSLFSSWSLKLRQDLCAIEKDASYPYSPMITAKLQIHEVKTDINECWPDPCQNGGTCTDGKLQYTCTCQKGYTGNNCQIKTLIEQDSIISTSQASTSGDGFSKYGADGIKTTRHDSGGCTLTYYRTNQWWSVQFKPRAILSVEITNRNDYSVNYLKNFFVYVSTESGNPSSSPNKQVCGQYQGVVPKGATVTIQCTQPLYGSYLIIYTPGYSRVTLCEATMYGYELSNLALYKSTQQSSMDSKWYSRYAVDGVENQNCAKTEQEDNPWWSVTLADDATVYMVDVTNAAANWQKLHDFDVYVTNDQATLTSAELCGHYTGVVGSAKTVRIQCTSKKSGKYVVIKLPGTNQILQLCEVKVYGTDW